MTFAGPTRGVEQLLRTWLGQPTVGVDEDALREVDSIDIMIVGLGLILVLLVLLRR